MSNLAPLDPSALTLRHERVLSGPPSLPTSAPAAKRVYRRPSPPPSRANGTAGRRSKPTSPTRLPMGPRPLQAPPQQSPTKQAGALRVPHVDSASHGESTNFRRIMLVGALATAATLAAVLIGAFVLRSDDKAAVADQRPEPSAPTASTEEDDRTAPQDARATADWQPYSNWEDFLAEQQTADAATEEVALTGKSLLASRFYEMDVDGEGRIVSLRMPADRNNRRFGPTMDEIAAIAELPHLKRLDLGDTIASAAVPIANRHPNVKVLVLENQGDATALRRLRNVEELQLKNSSIDPEALAGTGIKVVLADGR